MLAYELLYDVLWEMGLLNQVGQASGGSTTTVVDSILSLDTDVKVGGSVFIWETTDSAAPLGEVRRVSSNSSNTYTVDAYTAAVGAGDKYAYIAKDFNVYELLPAINMAIRNKVGRIPLVDTSITTALDQREYTLPVVVKEGEIMSVERQTNKNDSDDNRWAVMYDWSIKQSAAGSTALLVFAKQPPEGYTIRINYMARHPELTALSDNIHESIPPELAKAALKYQFDLSRNEEAIASQDGFRDLYNAARDEFEQTKREWPIHKHRKIVPARTFGRR